MWPVSRESRWPSDVGFIDFLSKCDQCHEKAGDQPMWGLTTFSVNVTGVMRKQMTSRCGLTTTTLQLFTKFPFPFLIVYGPWDDLIFDHCGLYRFISCLYYGPNFVSTIPYSTVQCTLVLTLYCTTQNLTNSWWYTLGTEFLVSASYCWSRFKIACYDCIKIILRKKHKQQRF